SVVDVATRRLVGVVELQSTDGEPGVGWGGNILIAGDHALVLSNEGYGVNQGGVDGAPPPNIVDDGPATPPNRLAPYGPSSPPPSTPTAPRPAPGASILLVDLATPRVLARARAAGGIVDARQVGSTVRVVLQSAPAFPFPTLAQATDEQR